MRLEAGYLSDGATGVIDIDGPIFCVDIETNKIVKKSKSWWVHDKLCDTGRWEDKSYVNNKQASRVLSDILWEEKRYVRSWRWFWGTWLFGGGKARDNGMF